MVNPSLLLFVGFCCLFGFVGSFNPETCIILYPSLPMVILDVVVVIIRFPPTRPSFPPTPTDEKLETVNQLVFKYSLCKETVVGNNGVFVQVQLRYNPGKWSGQQYSMSYKSDAAITYDIQLTKLVRSPAVLPVHASLHPQRPLT